jgi:4-hydroxy-tetrahydrodipicolinate reductase
MERKTRVIQYGCGVMGQEIVRQLLTKEGMMVVGAIDKIGAGNDLGQVIGVGKLGVTISDDIDSVLSHIKADVMVDATASHTRLVFPHLIKALEAGLNVVTICEEMTNPWLKEPELARRLDEAARRKGVTIVQTGLNPGFYADVLPLMITSACAEVRKIRIERLSVNIDMLKSPTTTQAYGIGLTEKEWKEKLAKGSIRGHVGFPETMHLIADALGWKLTEVREEREPLISEIVRDFSPLPRIEPGQCHGVRHIAYGMQNGETVMKLESTLYLKAPTGEETIEPGFNLWVEGNPNFELRMKGVTTGHDIIVGTSARAVSWIPYAVKAKPGLLTSLREFPLVSYCK